MKTTVGTLALIGAVLMAGSALAQTAPRGAAPHPRATPPPVVGSVPHGQPAGETRGTGARVRVINNSETDTAAATPDFVNVESSNRDHIDQDAPGSAGLPTNLGATPVNGIGGQGGGRYRFNTSRPPTTASATGTVPADQGQGQTRGIGQTPVNGVGGTGGGRLSNVPPTNDPDDNVAAEAAISTTRSNIKKPSIVMDGARTADPVVLPPIPPR